MGVRSALATTLAIQVLVALAALVAPVLAPLAGPEIGVAPWLVGGFVALMYLAAAVSGLVSGGFILRYGPIRVSQACLLLVAAASALTALGSAGLMLLAGLLLGTGYGPVTPASSHILSRTASGQRMNLVFSIKQTGVPIGNALAGALLPGAALLAGWRSAALGVALLCLLAALALQPLRPGFDSDRKPGRTLLARGAVAGPLRLVLGSPQLRLLAVTGFAYAGMQVSLGTFLVTFLSDGLGMPLVAAGLALSAAQAAGALGRILWGITADRLLPPLRLLGLLGLGMSAAALVAGQFTAAWPFALVLLVCLLFGGTAIAWNGVQLAQIALLAPPGRVGEVTGGSNFVTFGGVTVVPAAYSAILAATGSYALAFAAVAALTLASAIWCLAGSAGTARA